MAAPKVFTYAVTGRTSPVNHFPYDMLRYDRAWPESSGDAEKLVQPIDDITTVTVRLRSINKPTEDRWKSFGFFVADLRVVV